MSFQYKVRKYCISKKRYGVTEAEKLASENPNVVVEYCGVCGGYHLREKDAKERASNDKE